MTNPTPVDITDTTRPRPVRITAFLASVTTALLSVLTATEVLSPVVAGSLLGVVTVASMGGWLFVEQKVTPTSSPAAGSAAGRLVPLVASMPRTPEPPVPPVGFDR